MIGGSIFIHLLTLWLKRQDPFNPSSATDRPIRSSNVKGDESNEGNESGESNEGDEGNEEEQDPGADRSNLGGPGAVAGAICLVDPGDVQ
jgi:hypothetical protein